MREIIAKTQDAKPVNHVSDKKITFIRLFWIFD
jgi:hypothetical protein